MKTTERGFKYKNFKDRNGIECSIQKSSLATEDAIWFGADKIDLTECKGGEIIEHPKFDEKIPGHCFLANTRMHLTQRQVKKLLPILIKFAETGELE